jgi:hypothetical protein
MTLMLAVLLGAATIAWFAALFTQRGCARVSEPGVRLLLTLYPVPYSLAGKKFFGVPPAQHCERGEHAGVRASRGGDGH